MQILKLFQIHIDLQVVSVICNACMPRVYELKEKLGTHGVQRIQNQYRQCIVEGID